VTIELADGRLHWAAFVWMHVHVHMVVKPAQPVIVEL
jgi:hypothetical protein